MYFNLFLCFTYACCFVSYLLRQLRNKIEERRGMLWMRELMKKIQEQESSGESDYDN